jgi:hypothetical protein
VAALKAGLAVFSLLDSGGARKVFGLPEHEPGVKGKPAVQERNDEARAIDPARDHLAARLKSFVGEVCGVGVAADELGCSDADVCSAAAAAGFVIWTDPVGIKLVGTAEVRDVNAVNTARIALAIKIGALGDVLPTEAAERLDVPLADVEAAWGLMKSRKAALSRGDKAS